jgi:hypothetical protein
MSNQAILGPTGPFQEAYLNSDAQIMLVGGAAGSSKSLRWANAASAFR